MTPQQRIEAALDQGSVFHPSDYRKEFQTGASVAWSPVPWTLGCCARWNEETRKQHYQLWWPLTTASCWPRAPSYIVLDEGALLSSRDAITRLHKRALEA